MSSHEQITVPVPATSANLGSGFDCLGVALDLWNEVTIDHHRFEVHVTGEGSHTIPKGADNLVVKGVAALFNAVRKPLPPLRYVCRNDIPVARGLGSSSAALVAGIIGAAKLCGNDISSELPFQLAAELEGHPDNVAAAMYGGCQLSLVANGSWEHTTIPTPEGLNAVIFVPDQEANTSEARSSLPSSVSRSDAVFNIGRASLLVHAFESGKLDLLRRATEDRLHQPVRSRLFPATGLLIKAALDAGALGAFLSGAGPSVMAITNEREVTVQYEMREAARLKGISGKVIVTSITGQGAHLVASEP